MSKNSFEENMAELEGIVAKLEIGNATLEESLTAYENAAALVKKLNTILEKAEQKVKIISDSFDGKFEESSFICEEEKD